MKVKLVLLSVCENLFYNCPKIVSDPTIEFQILSIVANQKLFFLETKNSLNKEN